MSSWEASCIAYTISLNSHGGSCLLSISYTADVDLNRKLVEWESFYNLTRPHSAFKGKTPYEVLREELQ